MPKMNPERAFKVKNEPLSIRGESVQPFVSDDPEESVNH
jgi:hypothetical protein